MGLIESPIIEPTEAGHEREPAHHRGAEQGPGAGDRRHPAVPAPPLERRRDGERRDPPPLREDVHGRDEARRARRRTDQVPGGGPLHEARPHQEGGGYQEDDAGRPRGRVRGDRILQDGHHAGRRGGGLHHPPDDGGDRLRRGEARRHVGDDPQEEGEETPLKSGDVLKTFHLLGKYKNVPLLCYGRNRRRRRAFETTVTDDSPIAAAARMGESKIRKWGKRTPAATGMSTTL